MGTTRSRTALLRQPLLQCAIDAMPSSIGTRTIATIVLKLRAARPL